MKLLAFNFTQFDAVMVRPRRTERAFWGGRGLLFPSSPGERLGRLHVFRSRTMDGGTVQGEPVLHRLARGSPRRPTTAPSGRATAQSPSQGAQVAERDRLGINSHLIYLQPNRLLFRTLADMARNGDYMPYTMGEQAT